MIIKLLMEILKALIMLIIGLFPKLPETGFISNFISDFINLIQGVNTFISVPIVGLCFVSIILCFNARFIWSIIMWVIRKIPGVS